MVVVLVKKGEDGEIDVISIVAAVAGRGRSAGRLSSLRCDGQLTRERPKVLLWGSWCRWRWLYCTGDEVLAAKGI